LNRREREKKKIYDKSIIKVDYSLVLKINQINIQMRNVVFLSFVVVILTHRLSIDRQSTFSYE